MKLAKLKFYLMSGFALGIDFELLTSSLLFNESVSGAEIIISVQVLTLLLKKYILQLEMTPWSMSVVSEARVVSHQAKLPVQQLVTV